MRFIVNDEEGEWSGEDEDDQDELARLRKENATLRGRWLTSVMLVLLTPTLTLLRLVGLLGS